MKAKGKKMIATIAVIGGSALFMFFIRWITKAGSSTNDFAKFFGTVLTIALFLMALAMAYDLANQPKKTEQYNKKPLVEKVISK